MPWGKRLAHTILGHQFTLREKHYPARRMTATMLPWRRFMPARVAGAIRKTWGSMPTRQRGCSAIYWTG